jgi:predicted  nucleic acid-binding Zn-ribbon protein
MITINITKAKNIAHDARRTARSAEFAPLDIKATIPSEATAAEAERQVIRDKYAVMQTAIDAASTVEELKALTARITALEQA